MQTTKASDNPTEEPKEQLLTFTGKTAVFVCPRSVCTAKLHLHKTSSEKLEKKMRQRGSFLTCTDVNHENIILIIII